MVQNLALVAVAAFVVFRGRESRSEPGDSLDRSECAQALYLVLSALV
jgi:hypothetical protein